MSLCDIISLDPSNPTQLQHQLIDSDPTGLASTNYLPPIRPPLKSKTMKQTSKSFFMNSSTEHMARRLQQESVKKKIRNDQAMKDFLEAQRKRMTASKKEKSEEKSFKKETIFLSTKAGKMAKIQVNELRPALRAAKEEYKLREESIAQYLSPPSLLENYKMLSHLGKGGFSIVSLALNKQTNHRYAIKTYVKIDQIQNYKFDNIYRQIKHLHKLSHPNIVGLHHVVKDKRKLLLIMEDGGKLSLSGLMRKTRTITEATAKVIFRQIFEGVRHCHEKRISHRDLKLENILVDENNGVKIIDFGFSSKCGQKLQNFCGTPPYMAPEIAGKIPYHGEPADMWALGILLYLMLFGKYPFRATTEPELYRLIQQGKFEMGEGISTHAKETISKLLKCNIKQRATAQQILQGAWLR